MSDQQLVTSREDGVLTIRLNNPKTLNSLTAPIRAGLEEAAREAAADDRIRAVYLTGTGRAFCAGGDLESIEKFNDAWSTHSRFRQLINWYVTFARLPKPVVTGLNGLAVGAGVGLALSTDIIIGTSSRNLMSWKTLLLSEPSDCSSPAMIPYCDRGDSPTESRLGRGKASFMQALGGHRRGGAASRAQRNPI